jgi:peptide/nickel transport system permease protein
MAEGEGARRGLGTALAAAWLAATLAFALIAPLAAPYPPARQDLGRALARPLSSGHALGSDELGRDILSRIIYGTRPALIVGALTTLASALAGTAIGLAAACLRGLGGLGWRTAARRLADEGIMLAMDGLLAIPTVLLALAVVAALGPGLPQATIALGIVYCPVFARITRARALAVLGEGYVLSARALGTSPLKIVARHVLPNIAGSVIVQCALTFSMAVVVESSLSYLGLGTQPPEASWGLMLKDGRDYLIQAPWASVFPGLAIALTVLAFNALGDALADRLDPRSRGALN